MLALRSLHLRSLSTQRVYVLAEQFFANGRIDTPATYQEHIVTYALHERSCRIVLGAALRTAFPDTAAWSKSDTLYGDLPFRANVVDNGVAVVLHSKSSRADELAALLHAFHLHRLIQSQPADEALATAARSARSNFDSFTSALLECNWELDRIALTIEPYRLTWEPRPALFGLKGDSAPSSNDSNVMVSIPTAP